MWLFAPAGKLVGILGAAGFRDVADPRVTIAETDTFPDTVVAALDSARPFPDGADGPASDWSDRVRAMREVLRRLATSEIA